MVETPQHLREGEAAYARALRHGNVTPALREAHAEYTRFQRFSRPPRKSRATGRPRARHRGGDICIGSTEDSLMDPDETFTRCELAAIRDALPQVPRAVPRRMKQVSTLFPDHGNGDRA